MGGGVAAGRATLVVNFRTLDTYLGMYTNNPSTRKASISLGVDCVGTHIL